MPHRFETTSTLSRVQDVIIWIVFVLSILTFGLVKIHAEDLESQIYQVKVALALGLDLPANLPDPTEQTNTTSTQSKTREVYAVLADFNCPVCDRYKSETEVGAKDKSNPYGPIKFINQTPSQARFQSNSYPYLYWKDKSGRWRITTGWTNFKTFKAIFDSTDNQARQASGAGWTSQASKAQKTTNLTRYTWPGSLKKHLEDTHGVSTQGMTHDQMVLTHDILHNN